MRKQIGVAFCPTEQTRTLAILDPSSGEWVWLENFNKEEK